MADGEKIKFKKIRRLGGLIRGYARLCFWPVTIVAGLAFMLVLGPRTLAPQGKLVEIFDQVVFHGVAPQSKPLYTGNIWLSQLDISIHGGDAADRAFVRLTMERIRRLSGIKIIEDETAGRFDWVPVQVFIVPKAEWNQIGLLHGTNFTDSELEHPCWTNMRSSGGLVFAGQIYVSPDVDWEFRAYCVLGGLMRMIGFPGRIEKEHRSVLNSQHRGLDYSKIDRMLIRGYYGGYIVKIRDSTLRGARTVFWKLERDYKARGEAALIHPDYKPMPKAEMAKILATLRRHLTPKQQKLIKEPRPVTGK